MSRHGSSTTAELRAFVGQNADYYVEKWTPQGGSGRRFGFNWAAFFFGFSWLVYRRMYRRALLLLVGLEAVQLLLYFSLRAIVPASSVPADASNWKLIERLSNLLVSIIVGNVANRWYLEHASERVRMLDSGGARTANSTIALGDAGGVSLLNAVLCVVAAGGATELIEYLLHIPK